MLKWYIPCVRGPHLYYSYSNGKMTPYVPNATERRSDRCISLIWRIWIVFLISVPIVSILAPWIFLFLVPLKLLYFTSYLLRGLGRFNNPVYRDFLIDLKQDTRQCLQLGHYNSTKLYDFDISVLPPLFHQKQSKLVSSVSNPPFRPFDTGLALILSYFVYPGSVRFSYFRSFYAVTEGRYKITSKFNGARVRLQCNSGQVIDAMYAKPNQPLSNILIIACKGNYSCYEMGSIFSWLNKGYPAIGWNHCGYGYSSGSPTGRQEKEAIFTVVSYAVEVLGYPLERIMLHGNSIGAFTACYAAAAFPKIHSLLLESTFDDAIKMVSYLIPWCFPHRLVQRVLRYCYDLNNTEYLCQYEGPVSIVRKYDDILMRGVIEEVGSNRANFLLLEVIRHRYGDVFKSEDDLEGVKEWLCVEEAERYMIEGEMDRNKCIELLESPDVAKLEGLSDLCKQELAVFVATQLMKHQSGKHSAPLGLRYTNPPKRVPWND